MSKKLNNEENELNGLFSYYIFRIYKTKSETEIKKGDTH